MALTLGDRLARQATRIEFIATPDQYDNGAKKETPLTTIDKHCFWRYKHNPAFHRSFFRKDGFHKFIIIVGGLLRVLCIF